MLWAMCLFHIAPLSVGLGLVLAALDAVPLTKLTIFRSQTEMRCDIDVDAVKF